MFLTPEIFAGIAFIRRVEGKFAGTYIPTVFKGTFLYSILLFNLSTNFISFVFCNEWNLYILEYANLLELSITDVQKTSALNPSKIFRLKLLRANLMDHYKFKMPPLPFSFVDK